MKLGSYAGGGPSHMTINGGNFGTPASTGSPRYALDCTAVGGQILVVSAQCIRPIYDPGQTVSAIKTAGAGSMPVRSPKNYTSENFSRVLLGADTHHGVLPSPLGEALVVGMRDGGGSTFGNFEVRRHDGNRTRLAFVNGQTGLIQATSGIAPGGFGSGNGASMLSEESPRIVVGTAAPTAGSWVRGDVVINLVPTVGQPIGWTCTVTGSPGTWVAWANL